MIVCHSVLFTGYFYVISWPVLPETTMEKFYTQLSMQGRTRNILLHDTFLHITVLLSFFFHCSLTFSSDWILTPVCLFVFFGGGGWGGSRNRKQKKKSLYWSNLYSNYTITFENSFPPFISLTCTVFSFCTLKTVDGPPEKESNSSH